MFLTRKKTTSDVSSDISNYWCAGKGGNLHGVHITSDLSWTSHIKSLRLKPRRLLGVCDCNSYQWVDTQTLGLLHLTRIRPNWYMSLNSGTHISQRTSPAWKFASKTCCESWSADYHSMLEFLSVLALQKRNTKQEFQKEQHPWQVTGNPRGLKQKRPLIPILIVEEEEEYCDIF